MKDRIRNSREKSGKNACNVVRTSNAGIVILGILISILLMSSAASAGQLLKVSSDRHSVFSPWTGKNDTSLSMNFTGYALLLGTDGMPISGQSITFEIYNGSGKLKKTINNDTQQNGLARVSYDTYPDFASSTDSDYGNWTIKAYLTSDPTVKGSTNMSILAGGTAIDSGCRSYCHETRTATGAKPKSPYTASYGSTSSRAVAAHLESNHNGEACFLCHPGYAEKSARGRTGLGYTGDVHKNRACDYCHGDWTYIRGSTGNGIPKMPSCYECHPINNSNPSIISTLANLPGGNGISIYSYNFSNKAPLTAHNGTDSSLIKSVPCIICHGPAHNNTKPDPAPANTNAVTEPSQCISCHGQKHFAGTSCTDCHSQNAHAIQKPSLANCALCHPTYVTAVNNSKHNQTLNAAAPTCTGCHTGYDVQHTGKIVNESNTCRNSGCHETKDERHRTNLTSPSDCTQCHFANTTKPFSLNASLYVNDHNLTIIRNFYQYNLSGAGNPVAGMPLTSNGGVGAGTFPYYSCTMASCHSHANLKIENASQTWVQSNHARSLRYPAANDSWNNCAKCKSPLNYNDSLKTLNPFIAAADWQGINCRVCHNLHNRSFSSGAGPIAFYNATQSSTVGYDVYDKVSNATELCEKCHTGTTHNSQFSGTHKTVVGFDCADCHLNTANKTLFGERARFNYESHMFEVKNTTSSVTGCEVCHKAEDHTFPYTVNHDGKATCEACHDKTVSRNATGYAMSSDGKYGLYNDTATGEISSWKDSHGAPATWPLHNISKEVSCLKCHGTKSAANNSDRDTLLAPQIQPLGGVACTSCHDNTYESAWSSSKHNNSGAGAPTCTGCHTGYDVQHTGLIVNNLTTCINCHANGVNGFYQRHTSSADCTQCHFANTTQPFSLNTSLYTHDHNLKVEHNFYEYNISGMPVRTNDGVGAGMFPYYTCTLTCHKYNATTGVEGKIDEAAKSWFNSSHARSLHMSGDNKQSCAKCKSPPDYNVSLPSGTLIAQADWQGIQCRVCHNLHDRKFPNNSGPSGFPIAFYNSTKSSRNGYATYDQMTSATQLCESCHTGSSHDSKFGGTHKNTVGFNCTDCHMNSSFNNELHTFEVKNTTSGVTGCEVCHKADDPAFQSISEHALHANKATCEACHDKTVARNASGYAVNATDEKVKNASVVYGLYNDSATGLISSYKVSHGAAATWPLHNISRSVSCDKCHGTLSNATGLLAPELPGGTGCILCHDIGGSASTHIDTSKFGMHTNVNNTDAGLTDSDCQTCHFNTVGMGSGYTVNPGVNVYTCDDCHLNQSVQAPAVYEHYPGTNVTVTTVNCENCHSNSLNTPDGASTVNTAIGNVTHYGTISSLVRPTAGVYNSACNNCHNSAINMTNYGTQNKQITVAHTGTGKCNQCHVDYTSTADTLHNISLELPSTNVCIECHTTYADRYMAPNLTNTSMTSLPGCAGCHGGGTSTAIVTLADHNTDRNYAGTPPVAGTVFLDPSTVNAGMPVSIRSNISDTGLAGKVAAAQYQVKNSLAQIVIDWTAMNAVDGKFEAADGVLEQIIATIDTSGLSQGTYTVYVQGMDIGKQWSPTVSATLTVTVPAGFINGTVRDSLSNLGIQNVTVTTNTMVTVKTDSNGFYSLSLPDGTYTVTATKDPEFFAISISNVAVIAPGTTPVDIVMVKKATGTIAGSVSNG